MDTGAFFVWNQPIKFQAKQIQIKCTTNYFFFADCVLCACCMAKCWKLAFPMKWVSYIMCDQSAYPLVLIKCRMPFTSGRNQYLNCVLFMDSTTIRSESSGTHAKMFATAGWYNFEWHDSKHSTMFYAYQLLFMATESSKSSALYPIIHQKISPIRRRFHRKPFDQWILLQSFSVQPSGVSIAYLCRINGEYMNGEWQMPTVELMWWEEWNRAKLNATR